MVWLNRRKLILTTLDWYVWGKPRSIFLKFVDRISNQQPHIKAVIIWLFLSWHSSALLLAIGLIIEPCINFWGPYVQCRQPEVIKVGCILGHQFIWKHKIKAFCGSEMNREDCIINWERKTQKALMEDVLIFSTFAFYAVNKSNYRSDRAFLQHFGQIGVPRVSKAWLFVWLPVSAFRTSQSIPALVKR